MVRRYFFNYLLVAYFQVQHLKLLIYFASFQTSWCVFISLLSTRIPHILFVTSQVRKLLILHNHHKHNYKIMLTYFSCFVLEKLSADYWFVWIQTSKIEGHTYSDTSHCKVQSWTPHIVQVVTKWSKSWDHIQLNLFCTTGPITRAEILPSVKFINKVELIFSSFHLEIYPATTHGNTTTTTLCTSEIPANAVFCIVGRERVLVVVAAVAVVSAC